MRCVTPPYIMLVNHQLWVEHEGFYDRGVVKAFLKWGHYPEAEGKLDPATIRNAIVIDPKGRRVEPAIGMDPDASSRTALFLEFNAMEPGLYLVGISYSRGVYSIVGDRRWCYGTRASVQSRGYDVSEAILLNGVAKTYILVETDEAKSKPIGLDLELSTPRVKRFSVGDRIPVAVNYMGRPLANTRLMIRMQKGVKSIQVDEKGVAEILLNDDLVVISVSHTDTAERSEGEYDAKRITSSLTFMAG